MSRLASIFRALSPLSDVAVDRALASALPTADPGALGMLVQTLLQRERHEGTLALVEQFHKLPPELQEAVVAHAEVLYRPLREAISRGGTDAAANAIQIIQRSHTLRLAYLVHEQLTHGEESVRIAAAECLHMLARYCAVNPSSTPEGEAGIDAESAKFLQGPLEQAVLHFDRHHQTAVLRAALLLLPRPLPVVSEALLDHRSAALNRMRELATDAQHVEVRRALLWLTTLPSLAPQSMQGLRNAAKHGHRRDLMPHGHLLLIPSVRIPLTHARDPELLLPDAEELSQMSPGASRAVALWVQALPFSTEQRVQQLVRMQHSSDTVTRLAALRRLIDAGGHDKHHAANEAIAEFCRDSDEPIVRIALRHLVRVDWTELPQLLSDLVNSGFPSVRELAAHHLAAMGFRRLWQAWPTIDDRQRRAAGRALLKLDPGFPRHLADKLRRDNTPDRLRALSIIHTLNQGKFFDPALRTLAAHEDEKVASAAVRALSSADSEEAIESLEQALEHSDSRVRANAVESLDQARSTRHVTKLIEMAEQDVNRPRANAIAALMQMKTSEALAALQTMLGDDRAEHRTSALWLVESLGLIEVAQHVADLSVDDPDPKLRARALNVIEQLIGSLKPSLLQPTSEPPLPEVATA